MSLKFNNTEITQVFFNAVEKMTLQYNGTNYFGKRFSLTQNSSSGVTLTVSRTSSPNQRAATGSVATGNTIYYGDVITISVSANSNYTNPKLYVDTGGGMILRTSSYTFTVTGNVVFYGTATLNDNWRTVWSGSKVYTDSASFTVPGLDSTNNTVQITANITFGQWIIDQNSGEELGYDTVTRSINREQLPTTVYGLYSSMTFRRQGNQILFTAAEGWDEMKGYYLYEFPVSLEFTEVRSK